MSKASFFDLGPERLNRLLSIGKEESDDADDSKVEPSACTSEGNSLIEKPGSWIGRYKLLHVLGEGGMGIVYLAEQVEPIRRPVALKVIKPGMDSAQVIRRFEAERQALALLDHPNVAHVYDAGTTEAGRPYFVMEYVKGVPITEHCDRQRLTVEERLRLLVQVCEAIQHAHQKGIIHRDLKPSNILVSAENDQPIPKIIDFGVAKAISQPLTERTLFTEDSQLLGTPEYMSPEQAEMVNEDIDTRSDIYSLGVVLYELLTGVPPFDAKTLREGGVEHIRQVIREQEPKTPSTRLSTLSAEDSIQIAKRHRVDIGSLRRKLRGDLDWITLKAMEKDRMRRYQTAHALAEDIERHLNNELVLAGRPGTLYRFQKLVRRNKGVFAAVAVVAAVLVLGALVSTWQAARATRAERTQSRLRHEAETARAEETAQRRKTEALAYASDMSLAQEALARDDLGRAQRLLKDHQPTPGEVDLRGWEWRYLWQECRSDALGELCCYPDSAHSLAYSPDGKMLAVAGFVQGYVELWDVPGRKRIAPLQPKEGHFVTFSPRGDLLATGAGNQIRLWRTGTWDLVSPHALEGYVRVLKFSPDGTRLASLSYPDEVTVWEINQWTVVRRVRGVRLIGAHFGALDFSPDGKALVIGDQGHRLQVVNLASGNTDVNIPEAHSQGITSVAWSPNGSTIASGSGYLGAPIRLWDAASGKDAGEMEGHAGWICQLVFSPDGLWLYSASADQTIRIWDVGQRRCLATLRGNRDEVYGLAISPDGTTLASGSKDGIVAFWNARPRPEEEQPRLIPLGRFGRGAFSPDSRVLAAPLGGTVSLLDLATSEEIEQIPLLGNDVYRVLYSPDGTLLISESDSGKVRVWSCADHRPVWESNDPNTLISPIGFRPDSRRLLSVDGKGNAIWWDTLTWQSVRTFVLEMKSRETEAVSPDGRLLGVGTTTGTVHWLNAETGEVLATTGAHRHPVTGVAFSKDGSRAASVAEDGTLAIWDPSSFKLIAAFKSHMYAAFGVAFSPDGRRLATGGATSADNVKLWDLSTRRELMTLPGQGTLFYFVAFSPDGKWLAACSAEGQLHLWRAPSWSEIEAEEKRLKSVQLP